MKSTIEWTEHTWNPVTGCTKLSPASPGCANCYAATIAERFRGGVAFPHGFDVQLRENRLLEPLKRRAATVYFVNSMSDLFHSDVPDEYIVRVFAIMALTQRHTYQVLTKRPARMHSLLTSPRWTPMVDDAAARLAETYDLPINHRFPIENVWLGVSAENQKWADIRIPILLDTPAAVRFSSAEPLLGPIELSTDAMGRHYGGDPREDQSGLDWVIVGGESGPKARPMHPHWARSLRDQCVGAGIAFHFKQWGEWSPLAPLDREGRFDFRRGKVMAVDGTIYEPGDLAYPDGPRRGDAIRDDHARRGRLTSIYRVGKKAAGRELDDQTWDQFPRRLQLHKSTS